MLTGRTSSSGQPEGPLLPTYLPTIARQTMRPSFPLLLAIALLTAKTRAGCDQPYITTCSDNGNHVIQGRPQTWQEGQSLSYLSEPKVRLLHSKQSGRMLWRSWQRMWDASIGTSYCVVKGGEVSSVSSALRRGFGEEDRAVGSIAYMQESRLRTRVNLTGNLTTL
ncbi:hypothetical protein EJ03DRAFT_5759 [Teratosphaeria nubilosa]|uniref:Uncharacterized protein n=1 Tax=Teratosphaeria nubilosa TaxID=161662 RepID=A0A6G1LPM2_9PEZI|nr:hypothetical protein EJ03DRAFT_5759 [Teratosphaeria nubilosa]